MHTITRMPWSNRSCGQLLKPPLHPRAAFTQAEIPASLRGGNSYQLSDRRLSLRRCHSCGPRQSPHVDLRTRNH